MKNEHIVSTEKPREGEIEMEGKMGCRHTTTASYPLEIENHFSIRNEIATSVEIMSYRSMTVDVNQ